MISNLSNQMLRQKSPYFSHEDVEHAKEAIPRTAILAKYQQKKKIMISLLSQIKCWPRTAILANISKKEENNNDIT